MSGPAQSPSNAPPIEIFDPEECRRRLRAGGVGRIAMRGEHPEDAPELRPVNFALRDDRLVIRTGDGTILTAARRGEAASFEIDGIDPFEHTGWSVIVAGRLGELAAGDVSLRAWASGRKENLVGLSLERVTGMRIPPGRGNR